MLVFFLQRCSPPAGVFKRDVVVSHKNVKVFLLVSDPTRIVLGEEVSKTIGEANCQNPRGSWFHSHKVGVLLEMWRGLECSTGVLESGNECSTSVLTANDISPAMTACLGRRDSIFNCLGKSVPIASGGRVVVKSPRWNGFDVRQCSIK